MNKLNFSNDNTTNTLRNSNDNKISAMDDEINAANMANNPVINEEMYPGTMQGILLRNVGNFASVDFLIGTSEMIRKEGILFSVGISYIVLYDDVNGIYTVCDLYAIKFVDFYELNKPNRPRSMSNRNMNQRK